MPAFLATLADGQPWRTRDLIAQAGQGRKPVTVGNELTQLKTEGRIAKPWFGAWILAGIPLPARPPPPPPPRGSKPPRTPPASHATLDAALAELARPTTGIGLAQALGVTRSQSATLLRSLQKAAKITRLPEPDHLGRWLWLRADLDLEAALKDHVPTLPPGRARVLNALRPETWHWLGDIAATTGQGRLAVGHNLVELERLGLATRLKLGLRRYAAITARGLAHPARAEAPRAEAADMAQAFDETRIAVFEVLGVLGEAKTVDITGAMAGAERPAPDLLAAQQIGALVRGGLAEQVPGPTGVQQRYRLTEAGRVTAAIVCGGRTPPGRAALQARIADFHRATYARTGELRRANATVNRTESEQIVIDALADSPQPTHVLLRAVERRAERVRSIYSVLATLSRRGIVRRSGARGQPTLWELVPDTPPA